MRRSRKVLLAVAVLAPLAVAVRGIPVSSADGTCYSNEKLCHGVPTGEECFGSTSFRTTFSDSCESLEEVKARCANLSENICSANEQSIGTGWADKAKVFGHTCERWSDQYGVELRSC